MRTALSARASTDAQLLPAIVAAVHDAGQRVLARFSTTSRPATRAALLQALRDNDDAALAGLKTALSAAHPLARHPDDDNDNDNDDDDDDDEGPLPAGAWWVIDAVEGNINHVQGLTDWCVTVTLVRDNVPVVTAVFFPAPSSAASTTYTAVAGVGAWRDGVEIAVSTKTGLADALVGSGQAKPDEDIAARRWLGASVTAMLEHALLVRLAVPVTSQLVHVADGAFDVFWQRGCVRSGLAAGALLVAEAGGVVTDLQGAPWSLHSSGIVAAAPGVHAAALAVLGAV